MGLVLVLLLVRVRTLDPQSSVQDYDERGWHKSRNWFWIERTRKSNDTQYEFKRD